MIRYSLGKWERCLPPFSQPECRPARSPRNASAQVVEVVQARFPRLRVHGVGKVRNALRDAQTRIGTTQLGAHPARIAAIISQNGNAYEEGLGEGWAAIRKYWQEPTREHRVALHDFPTPASIKWQYIHGVSDESLVAPEAYTLEGALVSRPGNADIQLDLLLDYASNVAKYPEFQAYFREYQPPLLAVWGKNDPFFLPAGAEAWKRDIPDADVRFFDTGHFALETHGTKIIPIIRAFLDKNIK